MRNRLFAAIATLVFLAGCKVHVEIIPNEPVQDIKPIALKSKAITTLTLALNDANPSIRNNAIEIAIMTGQKQLMSEILKKLNDKSAMVRFTAAIAIGDMECQTCKDSLGKALNDPDLNVQIAGAYSMDRLGDQTYLSKIRDAYKSKNDTIKANVLLLLGKLNRKEDVNLMYSVLKDKDISDIVGLQAVDSLARMRDTSIYRSKLWPLLISKYPDDKVIGIRGMGLLGTKEAKAAIQTMLQDELLEVRLCAAEELGKLGYKDGIEHINAYFKTNPNMDTADQALCFAISALGWHKAEHLCGFLSKGLDSSSPYIRLLSAQSVILMNR